MKKLAVLMILGFCFIINGCTLYTAGVDLSNKVGTGFHEPSEIIRNNFEQIIKDWPVVIAFYKNVLGGEYQFNRQIPQDIKDSIKIVDEIAAKKEFTEVDKASAAGALLYLDYRSVSWLGDKSGATGYLKTWLGTFGLVL